MPEALVVGGGRGIGSEICLGLAREKWDVHAAGLTGAGQVARRADEAGLVVSTSRADVRDDASVATLAARWSGRSLDALVVTAGTAVTGRIDDTTPADVTAMLDEHVVGAYRLVRALHGPLARARGHVILLLSRMGRRPRPHGHAYGTAKAALAHLAGCLAEDLAADGIRVNCVSPGSVDTDLLRRAVPPGTARDPMPAHEVGRVVTRLLGPDFARVNGAILDVPGI